MNKVNKFSAPLAIIKFMLLLSLEFAIYWIIIMYFFWHTSIERENSLYEFAWLLFYITETNNKNNLIIILDYGNLIIINNNLIILINNNLILYKNNTRMILIMLNNNLILLNSNNKITLKWSPNNILTIFNNNKLIIFNNYLLAIILIILNSNNQIIT